MNKTTKDMNTMQNKEMKILKCNALKVDDNTAMIVAFLYNSVKHSPKESMYLYNGFVCDIESCKAELAKLAAETPDAKFNWPGLPAGMQAAFRGNDGTNANCAKFLLRKLKHIKSWDAGQEIFKGYKASKRSYNNNAVWQLAGAIDESGNIVDVTDNAAMLAFKGKSFNKVLLTKSAAKQAAKNSAAIQTIEPAPLAEAAE